MKAPRILLFACSLLLAGCINVPDHVKEDMQPPDGKRPNNFGKLIEVEGQRPRVEPDRPTIPPAEAP